MNAPVRLLLVASATCVALLALLLLAAPLGISTALVVGSVFLVLCVRFPIVAWTGYVASFCANGIGLDIGGAYLQLEMLCLPLLFLAMRGKASRNGIGSDKGQLLLLWFGIVLWFGANIAASLLNAPAPVKSIRIIVLMSCSLAAFTLVRRLKRSEATRYLVAVVVLLTAYATSVLLAWGIAQATGRANALVVLNYGETVYRTKGFMIEPNLLGSLLLLVMCVLFVARDQIPKALLFCALPVLGAATFLSFTRAAWVGMVFLALAWTFTGRRATLKATAVAIVGVFSFGVVGAAVSRAGQVLGATFSDRLSGVFDLGSGTGAYRARIWEVAVSDYFNSSHLLIGLGTNSYSQRHAAQDTSSGEAYLGNFWIVLVHDSGLLGVVGFLLVSLVIVLRARSLRNLPLYFALVVTALATNPMWFAFPWVCLGLILAMRTPVPVEPDERRGSPNFAIAA